MYYISIHLGYDGDSYYFLKDDFPGMTYSRFEKSDNTICDNWCLNKGQTAFLDTGSSLVLRYDEVVLRIRLVIFYI